VTLRAPRVEDAIRAAFEGSDLALQEIFWWGQWLVRALKRQRKHPKSRPGESVAETYGCYLELPPWPVPLVVRSFFAWEERRALARKLEIGTSLFAIASRSPAASDCAMSEA